MSFKHTPYDGSKQPFTVGLEPVAEAFWLEPDDQIAEHLERKAELLRSNREAVFRAEADTEQAQQETLALVVDHLQRCHAERYDLSGKLPRPLGLTDSAFQDDDAPLVVATQMVQEDLVLMRPGPEGYRLAAASLCFPSSWSLVQKFGQSMHDIHVGVPGFNGARMGHVVGRIFENLKTGQLIERYNWSIYDDPDLHHPQPKRIATDTAEEDPALLGRLFLRVERQTLRRLEGTGDILFTIKVHHDPMSALRAHPRSSELANGLRQQLLNLEPDQLAYKGLTEHQIHLAEALEDLTTPSTFA
ncbi:DUF3445 domain-containing protein [Labrenzia sp. CE80]|uniref:heme-dependent oxidative N-demethylase family protein n=1 Tax=Labrenzia sp. CE80 TaxID=1788986 RepID=UPI00129BFB30|nr:DUF3445 domain-containing protein [Labrenzia sp. CE80]